ncbi:hypothetical protein DFR51_1373 [Sphingosinicella microcystinivorans]|uniref:Uncharacterized protein n=1 Tax=Sphingosinicella microcystinivorans TaxID=335406 RepID=A0ABX9T3B2_SPHMI|nr:hypothetical protein DFR51_1373 [Sphingosinicella microcystinivorans]
MAAAPCRGGGLSVTKKKPKRMRDDRKLLFVLGVCGVLLAAMFVLMSS